MEQTDRRSLLRIPRLPTCVDYGLILRTSIILSRSKYRLRLDAELVARVSEILETQEPTVHANSTRAARSHSPCISKGRRVYADRDSAFNIIPCFMNISVAS